MKRFLSLKNITLALLTTAAAAFATEKVYLAPVSLTGLHAEYATITSKLMKTYMEDDGRFNLVVGTDEDSVNVEKQETIRNKAIDKGCGKYIIVEFTRLGENVITSFKLYKTSSDAPIWTDRLKAKNPDDFDPIVQRVSRNIGTKNKATDDSDIYSVTQQETKKPRRKGVSTYLGVGIGGFLSFTPEVNMSAGPDFFVRYDAGSLLFGLDWSIHGGFPAEDNYDKVQLMSFALSVYHPFGTKNIAPYVGGGFAYTSSSLGYKPDEDVNTRSYYYDDDDDDEYNNSGLAAFVGGGVLFNRASRVVVFLEAKYMIDFYKTSGMEVKKTSNGTEQVEHNATLNGFNFGLGLAFGF